MSDDEVINRLDISGVPVGSTEIHIQIRTPSRFEAPRQAIVDCLLVLRTRDGLPITDDQVRERANNILAALQGLGVIE